MANSHQVESLDPDEVFALLADQTRIAILQALWETDDREARFSTLRNSVRMRDAGQFNYHLSKLVGHFVEKRDDGYCLLPAGEYVIGAILSGGVTMTGDVDPMSLRDRCWSCDKPLWFEVIQNRVIVGCRECALESTFQAPPSVFGGHPVEEFPFIAQQYMNTLLDHLKREFCPRCLGAVQATFETLGDGPGDFRRIWKISPPSTFLVNDVARVIASILLRFYS